MAPLDAASLVGRSGCHWVVSDLGSSQLIERGDQIAVVLLDGRFSLRQSSLTAVSHVRPICRSDLLLIRCSAPAGPWPASLYVELPVAAFACSRPARHRAVRWISRWWSASISPSNCWTSVDFFVVGVPVQDAQEDLVDQLAVIVLTGGERGQCVFWIGNRLGHHRTADHRHDWSQLDITTPFTFTGTFARRDGQVWRGTRWAV